jgi:hypothetical protein
MTVEEAKQLIGKEAQYANIIGPIDRIGSAADGRIVVVEFANVRVNIDIIKIKDENGEWQNPENLLMKVIADEQKAGS